MLNDAQNILYAAIMLQIGWKVKVKVRIYYILYAAIMLQIGWKVKVKVRIYYMQLLSYKLVER